MQELEAFGPKLVGEQVSAVGVVVATRLITEVLGNAAEGSRDGRALTGAESAGGGRKGRRCGASGDSHRSGYLERGSSAGQGNGGSARRSGLIQGYRASARGIRFQASRCAGQRGRRHRSHQADRGSLGNAAESSGSGRALSGAKGAGGGRKGSRSRASRNSHRGGFRRARQCC